MPQRPATDSEVSSVLRTHYTLIAVFTLVMIGVSLAMRFSSLAAWSDLPLWAALMCGGGPLVFELAQDVVRGQFGADLLAGISIIVSILLGEYLAGAIVVLMLSGGEALESMTVERASRVLQALSRRMPSVGHRMLAVGFEDVPLES